MARRIAVMLKNKARKFSSLTKAFSLPDVTSIKKGSGGEKQVCSTLVLMTMFLRRGNVYTLKPLYGGHAL